MTAPLTDHGAAARGVLLATTPARPTCRSGKLDGPMEEPKRETRNANANQGGNPLPPQSLRTVEVWSSGSVRVTDFRGDRP